MNTKGLSLICALALSGCATDGSNVKQTMDCPTMPAIPAELMQEPTTEQQVRLELFEPPETPTSE